MAERFSPVQPHSIKSIQQESAWPQSPRLLQVSILMESLIPFTMSYVMSACVTKFSPFILLQITKPNFTSFNGHLPFTKAQTWRLYEPPLPMWVIFARQLIHSPSLEFVVHTSPFLKALAKFTSRLLTNFHTMHSLEPSNDSQRSKRRNYPLQEDKIVLMGNGRTYVNHKSGFLNINVCSVFPGLPHAWGKAIIQIWSDLHVILPALYCKGEQSTGSSESSKRCWPFEKVNKSLGKHFHPPNKTSTLSHTLFQTLLFSSIWSINQVGSFLAGFLAPLRIEESKTGPSKLLICPTNLGSFNQNAFKVIRSINLEAPNFNQIFAYFFASVKGSRSKRCQVLHRGLLNFSRTKAGPSRGSVPLVPGAKGS